MLRAVLVVVLTILSAGSVFAAAPPRKKIDEAELSRQITAAAQELFDAERKAVERWRKAESAYEPDEVGDGVGSVLFEDVISMLDTAAGIDKKNMHPHALLAQVLFLKAYQVDGTYDICSLLDARDEASWVVQHSSDATPPDLKIARDLTRGIKAIPADRIPDPPSACGDDDRANGSSTAGLRPRTRTVRPFRTDLPARPGSQRGRTSSTR